MLKDDIDNGWPVLYSGVGNIFSREAHSFICDGYDSDDKFHFNWGWRGAYDGIWFSLKNLKPGDDSNYGNLQNAIFNIRPDNNYYVDYCEASPNLPSLYAQYQALGGLDFWNAVPDNGRVLQSCDDSSPASWRTIPEGETSQYTAFESVVLRPGFTAEVGSNFRANIKNCPSCEAQSSPMLMNGTNESENDDVYPQTIINPDISDNSKEENNIQLFPNPNNGMFYLQVNSLETICLIEIRNIHGTVIYQKEKQVLHNIQIDISNHPQGIYFLRLIRDNDVQVYKIIKN
jgi:hypothetical protein